MQRYRDRYRIPSARWGAWDYASSAAYFVTICTRGRVHALGQVVDGEMILSPLGHAAAACWEAIPEHFPFIAPDAFIVMPDHVHGIIVISKPDGHDHDVDNADPVATQDIASPDIARPWADIAPPDGAMDTPGADIATPGRAMDTPGAGVETQGHAMCDGAMDTPGAGVETQYLASLPRGGAHSAPRRHARPQPGRPIIPQPALVMGGHKRASRANAMPSAMSLSSTRSPQMPSTRRRPGRRSRSRSALRRWPARPPRPPAPPARRSAAWGCGR
jgi:hypothetical protein